MKPVLLNLDDPQVASMTLAQLVALGRQLGFSVKLDLVPTAEPAVEPKTAQAAAVAFMEARTRKYEEADRRKTTACKQGVWFLIPIAGKLKAFREGMQVINLRAKKHGLRQIRYRVEDGSLHLAEVHCPIADRAKVLWQEFSQLVDRVAGGGIHWGS